MAPSGRPSRLPLRLRHLRIFFNLHSTAESPNHRIRTHRIFFKVLVLVQLLTKKLWTRLEMKSSLFRSATVDEYEITDPRCYRRADDGEEDEYWVLCHVRKSMRTVATTDSPGGRGASAQAKARRRELAA